MELLFAPPWEQLAWQGCELHFLGKIAPAFSPSHFADSKSAAVPKLAADHYIGLSRRWVCNDAYMANLWSIDKVWLHFPAEGQAKTPTLAKSRRKRL